MRLLRHLIAAMWLLVSTTSSGEAQEDILVQRYNLNIQRDKLNVAQQAAKAISDPKDIPIFFPGVAGILTSYPADVSVGAAAAKMIIPSGKQDMSGLIQTPPGYTICLAKPVEGSGAGQHGIETHGDTTFNTTLLRVLPNRNNVDGLGWYLVVPWKKENRHSG